MKGRAVVCNAAGLETACATPDPKVPLVGRTYAPRDSLSYIGSSVSGNIPRDKCSVVEKVVVDILEVPPSVGQPGGLMPGEVIRERWTAYACGTTYPSIVTLQRAGTGTVYRIERDRSTDLAR
jgi:hypothetical protein